MQKILTLSDRGEKRQGRALDTQEGITRVQRLEQVTHVTNMDPGLADGVGLFDNLNAARM